MRRLIQIGVAACALALVARTWLVEGVVDPVVVSGGSMAPLLRGSHRRAICPECKFSFVCGEESLPTRLLALCPNCSAKIDLEPLPVERGDRLIVDRVAYDVGRPERWDVVVLQTPDDPQSLCVKRVVGLPGETVEIRGGDAFADGKIVQRSMPQLLAMAIPVYDASCRPESGCRRWKCEGSAGRWKPTADGFACSSDSANGAADTHSIVSDAEQGLDWLVYEHEQTIAGRPVNHQVGPILDDLSYNQHDSRELVAVPDVILRCRIEGGKSGQLWLRIDDGRKQFELSIDAHSGRGEIWSTGQRIEQFSAGDGPLERPLEVVLALVDAQLRLTVGGKLLVDHAYDPAGIASQPTARPLAIGSKDCRLSVTDLKVLRDVYYLAAAGRGAGAPRVLGPDEYWLLGDNCAVSIDSRSWPAARANLFIGKALIPRGRR